ncbi:MAG TPA: GAF domain-containing protein [Bacteroidota bacterium]|nr:GAF domain-containing protein [Bacteroidota bacterium]
MESLNITASEKKDLYEELIPQIASLIADEKDRIAALANTTAALKEAFPSYSWVGFYLLKDGELVVGPFQGKIACTRIALNRGVCGAAATRRQTIVVEDVDAFPGHIACDGGSKSEIVVPLISNGSLVGVLDVDSYAYANFDETDKRALERLCAQIAASHF